ncbi:MAG TPA: LysR substrate-binding domain-containing protein [Ideonella sp.]|jgi:DNA-binding transcriptional LysR family regulator|nr:LysR substrate-binding domain-containing protein [Ideonella sp.]
MVSLDVLRTFLRVAELKSFSSAAQELGIARGIVSKRVAQLERFVGQAVLARSTRRVDLTPAGTLLVETLQRALHDIELGVEAVRELQHAPSGVLRITAPISWGQRTLCASLPRFLDQHPLLEVELVLSDGVVDLAAERFDIGFRMSATHDANLVAIPFAALERRLYAAPAYLKQAGTPRRPADLAGRETMVYWSPTVQEPLRLERGDEVVIVAGRSRFRANSPEAVLAATLAGRCIGALPGYVTATLPAGTIVPVLPRWRVRSKLGQHVYAVGMPERMRLARCRALLDFLRAEAGAVHPPA